MPDDDVNWGRYLGIGLQIVVGVLLGLYVGEWLDKRYHWHFAAVTGALLGMASGMYLLIKDAIRINKD